jgi:hypothetical protein
MFEAGALSKSVSASRVCPMLFGIEPSDVKGPLVQFQLARFDMKDMHRVLMMINKQQGAGGLEPSLLQSALEKWWPDLEQPIAAQLKKPQGASAPQPRDPSSILEEILALTRSVAITGVRSADTYRYTIHLVDAYDHLVRNTKKEWLAILFHCLNYLGSTIYPLADLTGDDELRKTVIYNSIRTFRDFPETNDLMALLAHKTGIPKEALLGHRATVEQTIQQTIQARDASVAHPPPEIHQ